MPMKQGQLTELLYQALETETGGIQVYTTALKCAQNAELKKEWQEPRADHEGGVFDPGPRHR